MDISTISPTNDWNRFEWAHVDDNVFEPVAIFNNMAGENYKWIGERCNLISHVINRVCCNLSLAQALTSERLICNADNNSATILNI